MSPRTVLAAVALALALAAPAQAAYTVTDLGLKCRPSDITNAGVIVGTCEPPGSVYDMASLWTGTGWMALGTLGGVESEAAAINNVGRIVGRAQTASGAWHAFRTLPYQGLKPADDLGTLPGDVESMAFDINEAGETVGGSLGTTWHPVAFRNGAWVDLGTLGGPSGEARAINANGWVVGTSTDQWGMPFGFRSAPGAQINPATDLLGFVSIGSGGLGVNDAGYAVGVGYPNGATHEAMMWDPAGRPVYIGTLPGFPAGRAIAVTGWLQVVGNAYGSSGWTMAQHPFAWLHHRMVDLNDVIPHTSSWQLQWVEDVNERGQIVGSGRLNGLPHGFLLTDNAPPTITCSQPDTAWHSSNVSLACTAVDMESGLKSAGDVAFSLTTSVAPGFADANASTGSRTVCDNAGNCATQQPIAGNKVDLAAPQIVVTAPAANTYVLNDPVKAAYSCSDAGAGIASCVGDTVDTASVGEKTFTVTATDGVGRTAVQAVSYTVVYDTVVLSIGKTGELELDLVDAAGVDVSSEKVGVLVLTIDDPKIVYDDPFAYSPSGTYVYDVSHLASGAHDLWYVVDGDPTVHHVEIYVY